MEQRRAPEGWPAGLINHRWCEQGLRIFGPPSVCARPVVSGKCGPQMLLEPIPAVQDLQSAWLLLSFCAGTRANHLLRSIPPPMALEVAANHTVSPSLFAADPGCRKSSGIVGSRCPAVVTRWIGPPEWPRVSPAAYWSSGRRLFGDNRQTAACCSRTVGDNVDQWSTRIAPRRSWRFSTHVGGWFSRSSSERFRQ